MTFSKNIYCQNRQLQVLFQQVYGPFEKFFVVLNNGSTDVASFDMIKHFDRWTIIHPAPDWIIPFPDKLSLMINIATMR